MQMRDITPAAVATMQRWQAENAKLRDASLPLDVHEHKKKKQKMKKNVSKADAKEATDAEKLSICVELATK